MIAIASRLRRYAAPAALSLVTLACAAQEPSAERPPTPQSVIAASAPSDWRALDPENTLYLDLHAGRVVVELAPQFAPGYVANVKRLVRAGYFNGLAIVRVQDDFVVQWGDPEHLKSLGAAEHSIPAEFGVAARDVPFTALPDADTYAPEVGFSDGFPAARDAKLGRVWLVHCYGTIGAARGDDVDSGNGSELYAVIGQAPRQLDRNDALVGRVVEGMELLSSLPRGTGPLGFYSRPSERVPIVAARIAADVPAAQRSALEVLRTDTRTFAALVESERERRDAWYKVPAGRVGVCNVPIPARAAQKR